ncbi:sugar kinase [Paraburkholderia caballeronis]|uniref:2-keto-3-deoxygluconate kinase n=1 Tax=Paraburkholderia caballeronis TaxID=416943 RepID=A0A1H7JK49_9BURK|nr:sugar kinase [Paraburkholderia caballeronis]PXW27391.1 2-keto-3-deoxygluconate kinase [Paraburkholderia caballeronis]PXX02865.1 2-keto-3-deoxygluconate kinase [Paraburkholderia caballeronis]RAK03590.1 2-keto-3-deoxygluconate kinase [Paraburkholderia caballeronis]SEC31738.1 2-keto-3-deoxygluconate kinase [Paraburkholderia caballeronis]SEK74922.1 2-keto-3-deoxygluconate kinase [Paraburkholderia caballeronis]
MAAATPQVLAFGEAMVEFNQASKDRPDYLQGFGGDTSNFCVAAARQGVSAGFVSALGDDHFGRLLLGMWAAEGVDTSCVRVDPAAPTGVYFVSHGPQGHAFDYLRAGSAASRYAPRDLPLDAIAAARVLHLSGISVAISSSACDAAFEAIAHARSNGVRVSFDTNLRLKLWPLARARAVMTEVLRQTDICLPSWDDVVVLTGLDDRDAIVDWLLAHGARIVALKLGKEGAYVATPDERRIVPGRVVAAVDATGAGDCFGGAFIARLVEGDDPFAAAHYANAAAALSTQGFGAVAPIPRREAVERMLAG